MEGITEWITAGGIFERKIHLESLSSKRMCVWIKLCLANTSSAYKDLTSESSSTFQNLARTLSKALVGSDKYWQKRETWERL